MTGWEDGRSGWGSPPPGGQPPQYNQPYYPPPPQQYPPQYPPPPQQYPPPQPYYPPQYPPPAQYQPAPYGQPQPPYGQPQQPYGQPQPYPPAQYPPSSGQPIVIPIEGRGVAKLAARMKPRSLTISPDGLAHEDRKGGFRIAWAELRRVAITTAYHQDRMKIVAPKVWRVRLVLDAADPSFPQRHPELAGLQGKFGGSGAGSYGVPLGPVPNIVDQLAQALAAYGAQVFGGVIEEGQVLGLGYL